jgi:hypothetical protein
VRCANRPCTSGSTGSVTYWSAGFSEHRFRDDNGALAYYPDACYSFNEGGTFTTGAPPYLTLGNIVRASFDVIGANGVHLALDRSVSLTQFQQGFDQPYGCSDYVVPNLQYFSHYCSAATYRLTSKSGDSFTF